MKSNGLKCFVFLGLLSLTFMACKSRKLVVVPPPAAKVDSLDREKAGTLQLLQEKNSNYQTLSLRGKAQLNMNGNEQGVTVNIRMLKDKKIWMSLTAIAGIEVARVLVTPDSLLLRNNIDGVAIRKPFSYIHRYASKEIDFKLLQALFAGNTTPEFLNESASVVLQSGQWQVNGRKNNLGYQVLFNTLLKVSGLSLNDVNAAQALKVSYGEYQEVNASLYPSSMQFNSLSGTRKISLAFDFTKIESNVTMDFPFTVPKRFELIN